MEPYTDPHLLTAHAPHELVAAFAPWAGFDLLLTQWPNGILTVAFRTGNDDRGRRWSPPVTFVVDPTGLPMPAYPVIEDDHGTHVEVVGTCPDCTSGWAHA